MNWLDILLAIILCSSAFAGLRRGLARTVIGFVSSIVAVVASIWLYGAAGSVFTDYVSHRAVANVIGFIAVFVACLVVGSLLGWLIARTLKKAGLGWLDGLFGAGVGLLRGTIVSVAIVLMVSAFTRNPPPPAVAQSQIAPYVMGAANVMAQMAPAELRQGFDKTYEKVKKLWYGLKTDSV
ncbi:MAG: CvpA family protein [Acidobacteria bacterium]|nr:CvpA family protein [Acidobacteriota bacterium]